MSQRVPNSVAHSGYPFFHVYWRNRKCLASGRVKLNALKHFDFPIVVGKIVWALASIPGSATNDPSIEPEVNFNVNLNCYGKTVLRGCTKSRAGHHSLRAAGG
jgi:hypothetical protein